MIQHRTMKRDHPTTSSWSQSAKPPGPSGSRIHRAPSGAAAASGAAGDDTGERVQVGGTVPGHRVDVGALGDLVPTDHTPSGG